MYFVVAGSVAPLSAANNSTTNDVDDADDDDYDVDGDDDSDDSDDDFACSDSDDSEVKRDKKKVESKTGRGLGRAQKTDTNKATARIKRISVLLSHNLMMILLRLKSIHILIIIEEFSARKYCDAFKTVTFLVIIFLFEHNFTSILLMLSNSV